MRAPPSRLLWLCLGVSVLPLGGASCTRDPDPRPEVTLAKSEPSEPLPPLAPSPPAEEPAPRAEPAQPSSAFADGRAALKTRNFAAAAAAFEVACEQEDQPYACVELARLLDLGRGVREDPDRAKGLLMRACAAEVLSACDQLGH